MKNLKKIKGDASFRKFFRKKNKGLSSIIVYSKKEKLKNLLIYDAINKILRNNKILAPELYKENYNKNFIEIQDFGNETIYKILRKKKVNKFSYFKKIIQVLNKIQAIKDTRVKNFKKNVYILSIYEKKILLQEANIFCDWYVAKNLSKQYRSEFVKKYKKIVEKLASNLKMKNNIFVHRDFHISNLMLFNNQIGLIDSQDALIGNRAYDLASLIDDVRFQTSKSLKNKIYKYYIRSQKKLDKSKFQNDFYVLSILRNLKVIGIFTRLAIRDGKKNYLKLIPHAWSLINMRIHEKKEFMDLKVLLSKNFKGKIK